MKEQEINKFLSQLAGSFFLFGPQKDGKDIEIKRVRKIADLDWSGEIPKNTWKEIFFPCFEQASVLKGGSLVPVQEEHPPLACVNVNILDLRALTLFEQVFSRNPHYQARRRSMILIGLGSNLSNDYKKYKVFSHNFEEDILEHVVFDVFFVKLKNKKFKAYSGSEKGQILLEQLKVKDYEHVEFAGAISEKGLDKRMLKIKEKVAKSSKKSLWFELNKICLACGKCSINCPTCFCFDLFDTLDPSSAGRNKCWTSCFFNDFSIVAGGGKELDTVREKIYFWHTHKFVRIPHEFGIPGCVSCGRCIRTCPVKIDISKNIAKLLK